MTLYFCYSLRLLQYDQSLSLPSLTVLFVLFSLECVLSSYLSRADENIMVTV